MTRNLKDGDVIYANGKGRLCCINRKQFDGWWYVGKEKLSQSFISRLMRIIRNRRRK